MIFFQTVDKFYSACFVFIFGHFTYKLIDQLSEEMLKGIDIFM